MLCDIGKLGKRCYKTFPNAGTTVLELISAFEEASGVKINTEVCGRRKGDVSASFASCDKIERELGWKAELSIKDMCEWFSRQKTKQGTCSGTCGGKNSWCCMGLRD